MTAPTPEPAALAALERLAQEFSEMDPDHADEYGPRQALADIAVVRATLAAQAQREQRLKNLLEDDRRLTDMLNAAYDRACFGADSGSVAAVANAFATLLLAALDAPEGA